MLFDTCEFASYRYKDSEKRFQHVLEACGVNKSLIKLGVKEGDTVFVGDVSWDYFAFFRFILHVACYPVLQISSSINCLNFWREMLTWASIIFVRSIFKWIEGIGLTWPFSLVPNDSQRFLFRTEDDLLLSICSSNIITFSSYFISLWSLYIFSWFLPDGVGVARRSWQCRSLKCE